MLRVVKSWWILLMRVELESIKEESKIVLTTFKLFTWIMTSQIFNLESWRNSSKFSIPSLIIISLSTQSWLIFVWDGTWWIRGPTSRIHESFPFSTDWSRFFRSKSRTLKSTLQKKVLPPHEISFGNSYFIPYLDLRTRTHKASFFFAIIWYLHICYGIN